MIDYNLPSDLRVELRKSKKWFGMGGAIAVLGFLTLRPLILAGFGITIYGMIVESRAKKRIKTWKKENGYI